MLFQKLLNDMAMRDMDSFLRTLSIAYMTVVIVISEVRLKIIPMCFL